MSLAPKSLRVRTRAKARVRRQKVTKRRKYPERIKRALAQRRELLLWPLRLIHPEYYEDPMYRQCYQTFFRVRGITSPLVRARVLQEVAGMPSFLSVLPRYKNKTTKIQKEQKEQDGNKNGNEHGDGDGDGDRENEGFSGPSDEAVQRMDDIVATLKPSDFDTAGFDEEDESRDITEEALILSESPRDHVVL